MTAVPPGAVTAADRRVNDDMWRVAGDYPDATTYAARTQLLRLALEAAAPLIAAAERERIFRALLTGDPGRLESAFRAFVDDEEAADCALAVADLLREDIEAGQGTGKSRVPAEGEGIGPDSRPAASTPPLTRDMVAEYAAEFGRDVDSHPDTP